MGVSDPYIDIWGNHWTLSTYATIAGGGELSEAMNTINIGQSIVKGASLYYKSGPGGASSGIFRLNRPGYASATGNVVALGTFSALAGAFDMICTTSLDLRMNIGGDPAETLLGAIGTLEASSTVIMTLWGERISDDIPPITNAQPVSLEGYKWPLTRR